VDSNDSLALHLKTKLKRSSLVGVLAGWTEHWTSVGATIGFDTFVGRGIKGGTDWADGADGGAGGGVRSLRALRIMRWITMTTRKNTNDVLMAVDNMCDNLLYLIIKFTFAERT